MTKTFQWSGSVVVVAVVINLLLIQTIFADEPCGNIIKNGESQPIDNCDNPFNAIEAVPVDIVLEGTLITPDIDVTFNTTWGIFDIEPANPFNIALYKQEGSDYIFQQALPDSSIRLYRDQDIEIKKQLENEYYYNVINQQVNWSEVARNFDDIGYDYQYVYDFEHDYATYAGILPKGNYVLIFTSNDGPGGPDGPQLSLFEEVKNLLIPTAYAQGFPGGPQEVFSIPFTVNGGDVIIVPEPEIDELILQYAPILYFHPNEDYFPMDVESFVEASSLWNQSGADAQVHSSSSLTFEVFEDFIKDTDDTSNYYLAFSSPEKKKTIDLENAHTVYNNLRKTDAYTTTTYYHKMNAATDDGREFIVLQYWYFYAMNNWREHDGVNNHEGDWESVFIFLDQETESPKFIAYSSHLNDGDPEDNIKQYGSVRREWGGYDVAKEDNKIVSFVSQGSHANYPNNNNGEHDAQLGIDKTSTEGPKLKVYAFKDILEENTLWDDYRGKWGTDTSIPGFDGPQGPRFIDVTSQTRFDKPLQWAGIDDIIAVVLTQEELDVLFPEQGVSIVFDLVIPAGTTFEVSPHDEVVTFGLVPIDSKILPHFWDIETSLEEETFDAQLTLPYNLEEIQSLGYTEEDIVGAYYDPILNSWSYFPATFDSTAQTATFDISHFSRYALAVKRKEEIVEIEVPETATVTKTNGSRHGTRIKRPEAQILGVSTSSISVDELQKLVNSIELLAKQYPRMNESQKGVLLSILRGIIKIANPS